MGSNTCLQFVVAFGTVFLVVLNALCLLLGIGLIVIGVKLKDEIADYDDILELMDRIQFGNITLRDIIMLLFIIVIIIGVFALLTSLLGGVGAFFKFRVMLVIYIVILVLCIIVELVGLAFWVNLIEGVHNLLFSEFNDLLKRYNGPTSVDVYSVGWNVIFVVFGCCAVTPTTFTSNDFQTLPSTWWSSSSRGGDLIPQSCCDDATLKNYVNYTNTACTQTLTGYYESGCYDVFQDLFDTLVKAAISIIGLLVLVEVVAIFFSVVIIYHETRKKKVVVV